MRDYFLPLFLIKRSFLFTLILSAFLNISARSQFRFDSWTTDNGLPQASINSILQTRDGFLWFTTFGGLVRYDGLRFQVFNTGNTKGLRTSRFLQLYEDKAGNLWIATERQGVTRYRDGVFTTFGRNEGVPDQMFRTGEDKDGNLLLITLAGKDAVFRQTNEGFVPLAPEDAAGILRRTSRGNWSCTDNRLQKVESNRLTVDFATDFQVGRCFEDSHGRLWVVSTEPAWYLFDNGQLTNLKEDFAKTRVGAFFEDREGRIWFATPGSGLVLFANGKFTRYTISDGLAGDAIQAIYQDREGTIWVGTESGLSRLTERAVTAYSVADGLAADNVYPIYEDRAGRIWAGSWMGLTLYENGTFQNVGKRFGVENIRVTALLEDRAGDLWIGTLSHGIVRIKNGQAELYSYLKFPWATDVRAVTQDRQGNIWFGTGNGLARFKDEAFTRLTANEELAGKQIFNIYEDSKGNLWFATNTGLAVFENGAFKIFTESDGIAAVIVRSIKEDSDGALWIGMYDSGLYRYKGGQFTHYTTNEGLFDNGAFQIIEDERGNFWISCNLGIYRIRKSELNDFAEGRIKKITSVPYNKRDGMLNAECNGGAQPAGIKAKDGRIWFPTQKGVAVINPEAVPFNSQPPPVVIESFLVDAKAADIRQPVKIQPGQTYLEIHYSGLSFINPELVKFKYKLEGLDEDWIDADTRRTAFYTHLPPGKYNFRVLAANRDGVWNERGATLEITVLPPFWRTWWFLSFSALALGALAFTFYRWRINALKRAHAAQEEFSRQLIESQEAERTRIAKELHDGLGQSLVLIRNWALLGIKAEDIKKSNLNVISETASEAINEVREIAYNLGPYQLDRLGLKLTIEEMIQKVAATSPIRFQTEIGNIDGRFSKDAEINIFRVIQEAVNNIVKHSEADEAEIKIRAENSSVFIAIQDNGKGFAPESHNGRRGFGLLGMTERVNLLKGELLVESEIGKGTIIRINLPQNETNNGR